jgi:hypothetical protein
MCFPRVFPIASCFNPICFRCMLRCSHWLVLFPFLSLGGPREGIFLFIFPWFQMCSHNVPFKFSMGSHHVLNVFPNMFSIAPHFLSHKLWQMLSSFHPYSWAKGGGTLYLKASNSIWHLVKAQEALKADNWVVLVGEETFKALLIWMMKPWKAAPLVCWWTSSCLHVLCWVVYASQVRVNLSPNLNHSWWS